MLDIRPNANRVPARRLRLDPETIAKLKGAAHSAGRAHGSKAGGLNCAQRRRKTVIFRKQPRPPLGDCLARLKAMIRVFIRLWSVMPMDGGVAAKSEGSERYPN
jgi:hypothetical protein